MKLCLISMVITFVLTVVIRIVIAAASPKEQAKMVLRQEYPPRVIVLTLMWVVSCITMVVGAIMWIVQA